MASADTIGTCFEIDVELVDRLLAEGRDEAAPFAAALALIGRMAALARPRQGAARILIVYARLIERILPHGAVTLSVAPDGERTALAARISEGGARRVLHDPIELDVPFDEFMLALERRIAGTEALEVTWSDPISLAFELTARGILAPAASDDDAADDAAGPTSAKRRPPPLPPRSARQPRDPRGRPTLRLERVEIPPEAYRDDAPPVPAGASPDRAEASKLPPTVRLSPRGGDSSEPAREDSVASRTDGDPDALDDGWD
ncbi:MAG: hypothetical protein OZ928_17515 [Polyangiaceae bacterium]|nr:hypothetical protein [Polyangiaceae bacterium]